MLCSPPYFQLFRLKQYDLILSQTTDNPCHWYCVLSAVLHGAIFQAGATLGKYSLDVVGLLNVYFLLYLVQNMAATCLYLAGKVEEQPKKVKDIIGVGYKFEDIL